MQEVPGLFSSILGCNSFGVAGLKGSLAWKLQELLAVDVDTAALGGLVASVLGIAGPSLGTTSWSEAKHSPDKTAVLSCFFKKAVVFRLFRSRQPWGKEGICVGHPLEIGFNLENWLPDHNYEKLKVSFSPPPSKIFIKNQGSPAFTSDRALERMFHVSELLLVFARLAVKHHT